MLTMKKLKGFKVLRDVFIDSVTQLDVQLQEQIKIVKKEYQQQIVEEKVKLMMRIGQEYNLDINELKTKYLKPRELSLVTIPVIQHQSNLIADNEEQLLTKITFKDIDYWLDGENLIYNTDSKLVGKYENETIIFNKK
jgi:hypothetical protein